MVVCLNDEYPNSMKHGKRQALDTRLFGYVHTVFLYQTEPVATDAENAIDLIMSNGRI